MPQKNNKKTNIHNVLVNNCKQEETFNNFFMQQHLKCPIHKVPFRVQMAFILKNYPYRK